MSHLGFNMLQCTCWFPEGEQDKLASVARWTAVLTPLLKMHCRWQTDVHIQLQVRLNLGTGAVLT